MNPQTQPNIMTTKHTAGPWKVGKPVDSMSRFVYVPIITDAGRNISCAGVYGHERDGSTANATGDKWPKDTHKHHISEGEAMANAQLIAAAPELLEALEQCVSVLKGYASHDPNGEVSGDMVPRIAMAAIAKARGGQP